MSGPAIARSPPSVELGDPRNDGAVREAKNELDVHRHFAAHAHHHAHQLGLRADRRHEVDDRDRAALGDEGRLEDHAVAAVAALDAGDIAGGRDPPPPMLGIAKEGGEAGAGIEARPAEPVDRSVAADERARLAVTDECVILDSHARAAWQDGDQPVSEVAAADVLWSAFSPPATLRSDDAQRDHAHRDHCRRLRRRPADGAARSATSTASDRRLSPRGDRDEGPGTSNSAHRQRRG